MNNIWTIGQRKLVSENYCAKNIICTTAALVILGSTPVFSNTPREQEDAVSESKITLILPRKANRRGGKPTYICSPAGFGKKSTCFIR